MKYLVFLLFLFNYIHGHSQLDYKYFQTDLTELRKHELLSVNDSIEQGVLFQYLQPKTSVDSAILEGIECYTSLIADTTSEYKSSPPLSHFIHFLDINNDKEQEILLSAFVWGCYFMTNRIYYKNGTYLDFEPGLFHNTKWRNDSLIGFRLNIPYCCASPFYEIMEYVYGDGNYYTPTSVCYFDDNLPLLTKKRKWKLAKVNLKNITLYSSPVLSTHQYVEKLDCALTDDHIHIIEKKDAWSFVIIKSRPFTAINTASENFYIAGWTKL